MRISDWRSDVCSSDLRVLIKAPEHVPVRLGKAVAGQPVDGDPVFERRRPLLAKRLALARLERPQKILETAIALIGPVELLVLSDQPPGLRSEEHTSELKSLMRISYAVFCLKKHIKLTYITPVKH